MERALTADGKPGIDLVYVIPYPLSQGNDVGGRTLLALAIKGRRTAVMSVEGMKRVVAAIMETGTVPEDLRIELADEASFEIAKHYSLLVGNRKKFDTLFGRFSYSLLNGENPYQVPASAFMSDTEKDALSLFNFRQLSGEPPCFTNMADADCILNTLCLATEAFKLNTGSVPYTCVAAKHGNACGLGVSKVSPIEAVEKALFGNPRSIWGGEVIVNFPVDAKVADILYQSASRESLLDNGKWMLDLVMGPYFTPEAVNILGKRSRRKIFENEALLSPAVKKSGFNYRMLRGGFLRQPPAAYILDLKSCELDGFELSENEIMSLIVSWAVVFSSNHGGNEVALAKNGVLLGVGGGASTVEAARVAVSRTKECGHDVNEAAFAADAFFPFTDAPAILCDAGVSIGCVPDGGKNEAKIKEFFSVRSKRVVYIPREFRGFCRH